VLLALQAPSTELQTNQYVLKAVDMRDGKERR
jgi:hypothetical protein